MPKDPTPRFSRKILLISLIFLLANLGVYGLRLLLEQPGDLQSVAPKLVSARPAEIEVQSPYEEDYKPAVSGQEIFSHTSVRTGEKEFAELILGSNTIRMDEETEITLLKNNFPENGPFIPHEPRLVFELKTGSIWVSALDLIEVRTPRTHVSIDHGVGIITYSSPINRVMVVTGAANLSLLDTEGGLLSNFVVPLQNQVTFVDSQITPTYAALKPSKLRKELKMSPISDEVLADDWVRRNANDFESDRQLFEDSLITSDWVYRIRTGYQKALSKIAFLPEARRNMELERARTQLAYILGGIQQSRDLEKAEAVLKEFSELAKTWGNDPKMSRLIADTLFSIEYSRSGTPAYMLKEALIGSLLKKEGPSVLGIYLTDLRRAFYEDDLQATELVTSKWLDGWRASLTETSLDEFDRQSQILEYTVLSYIDLVTQPVLDAFDETGEMKMAYATDMEEARYEVITDRLQITASLVTSYRYALAKQYLKSSYLNLEIEDLSPQLASTQIFLENGKLLAQRIEYAEDVLHGAAEPIDETRFRDYFKTLRRDEALSADLKTFFQLDEEEEVVETTHQAPTPAEVAGRFLDSRINVNYSDISLQSSSGYYYTVKNARLIDRGPDGEAISFDATYDYVSNSVTDVVADGKSYRGSYTLSDIVTALKSGGQMVSRVPTPSSNEGLELLLTDREKIEALEGQAIAQDVARQLAFNRLKEAGITIAQPKFSIEILDELNLDRFRIKNAIISRPGTDDPVRISFEYRAKGAEAVKVINEDGVALLDRVPVSSLKEQVLAEVSRMESQFKIIDQFMAYAESNDLFVDRLDITYTDEGLLSVKDLELLTLGIRVSGLINPQTLVFRQVSHPLLSRENIGLREYFEELVDLFIVSYMEGNGFSLVTDQVQTEYPFQTVEIQGMGLGGYRFTFELDLERDLVLRIRREGSNAVINQLNLDELKSLPMQLRLQEATTGAQQ